MAKPRKARQTYMTLWEINNIDGIVYPGGTTVELTEEQAATLGRAVMKLGEKRPIARPRLIVQPGKIQSEIMEEADFERQVLGEDVQSELRSGHEFLRQALPEGFLHYKRLREAGIRTYGDLEKASDDELLGIHGIGPASVSDFREIVRNEARKQGIVLE